jgi:glycosyltransferase involved in cell wall biosynthesis
MIAYNHEAYIREAIKGVLIQQTNFEYELIISNDGSPDHTNEVINDCIANHPKRGRIKYFHQQKNLGMQSNFIFALSQCRGKYVALCEGDDYWTDPLKLQKQVDYISKHNDCNLVFTDVKCFDQKENKWYPNWATIDKEKYEFKDLAERNVITTCTVLFRNPDKQEELGNYLSRFSIGDYPLYLFLLRSGYGYYLKDITSVYWQHTGGVFSSRGPENLINTHIQVLQTLKQFNLSKQEFFLVRRSLIKWYYTRVVRMSSDSRFHEIRPYVKKHLKLSDINCNKKYFLKAMLLYLFPKLKTGVFQSVTNN